MELRENSIISRELGGMIAHCGQHLISTIALFINSSMAGYYGAFQAVYTSVCHLAYFKFAVFLK